MLSVYLVCTGVAVLACGYAAYSGVRRTSMVTDTAARLGIAESLMVPFSVLLGLAGVGLVVGTAVPVIGTAAACGLVAYFVTAVGAHLRARDLHLAWPLAYLALAVVVLATGLAWHGPAGAIGLSWTW